MKKNVYTLLLLIAVLVGAGCRTTLFDDVVAEEREWQVPIGEARITMQKALKNFDERASLDVMTDGTLLMRYKGTYLSKSSSDVFAQFRNAAFPITSDSMGIPFTTQAGVRIESVDVKGGTLSWIARSPVSGFATVTFRIPHLKRNGVSFERVFDVSAFPTQGSLDMTGWRFERIANSDSMYFITSAYDFVNNRRVSMVNNMAITVQNYDFSLIKGILGRDTFDNPRDSIKIDFYEGWKRGTVRFENPSMTTTIENSAGTPVRAFAREMTVVTLDGRRLAAQSVLNAGVNLAYPSLNEIGQWKTTVIEMNKTNSNIADMINSQPVSVVYDIDGVSNPDTSVRAQNFLTDSSGIKMQVEMKIPVIGAAKDFEIRDTMNLDFSKVSDKVSWAEFKINADNGMPVDITLQGYFLNNNGVVLDSFFVKNATDSTSLRMILRGCPVDANGFPTARQKYTTKLMFDKARMPKVLTASKLAFKYGISTTNNGSQTVRLTNQQDVILQVGVRFGEIE